MVCTTVKLVEGAWGLLASYKERWGDWMGEPTAPFMVHMKVPTPQQGEVCRAFHDALLAGLVGLAYLPPIR